MTPSPPDAVAATPPHWREIDWSQHERTAQVSGLRVNYVDYGTGDAVVLVHGLGGSWQSWLENIPRLGVDHRVIAIDLPGFGRSEALAADGEIADHVEVLTDLLDRLHIRDAIVVGHSLGGLVSLFVARSKSERVRALVLVSGGGVELSPVRLSLIVTMFRLFSGVFGLPGVASAFAGRAALRRILLWPALGDSRSMSAELAAVQIPLMNAPGFVATARAAAAALPGVRPGLIAAPTLLIWGARDRILPVTAARELAAEMPSARLVVLDGIGHCAMFEAPDEVNRLLVDFVGAHPAAGRPAAPAPVPIPSAQPNLKEERDGKRAG